MKGDQDISSLKCKDCIDKSCATAVLDGDEQDQIFRNRYATSMKKGTNILNEGSPTSHIV